MESSQETVVQCDVVPDVQEVPQQLSLENHCQSSENPLPTNPSNDTIDPQNISDQISNSGNPTSVETTDVISQDVVNDATDTSSAVSTDNSMPPLPPPSKDNKGQPTGQYPADYNMQNYANYNYMYNYNNYYGYPYPQYQWDYNSQQYYQPYQNYYNYNYNANQAQTASSKPPPPPPDAVQLPVEEKPTNKTNVSVVDDSNRYSPTAETDDDDTMKGWSENNKSDGLIEQTIPVTTTLTNSVSSQTVLSEKTEIDKPKVIENIENKLLQPTLLTVTQMQPQLVPVPQTQPYTIPIQQPHYLINPQVVQQMQPSESNELINQHQNVPAQNGKEDSTDKLTKVSSVLGKNQAKKRLMAFSMMKQKLQEQNNSSNDYQNLDVGDGNDVEFVPELNVFQTVAKKKVVTNKKVTKVIKAQQTIEQIEEMKKDELLQGNNAALYQQLLRNGGNEAPILQKLGIESLAEKYSAKIREQDKRLQRHHHHRRRDNARRGHKYRRHSHSKSRSRSRSAEKPKMRALEVKSWTDFINGGFQFDKFRRFKIDETEEMKGKERKSRMKKRHGVSRSDGKNQNAESLISTETEIENSDQKSCFNILERKKEILKSFEVISLDGECTKDFPSSIVQHTKTKPFLKYSENPSKATCHLQNRQQMLATLLPEIEAIVIKFLSSIQPKKMKENLTEDNLNSIDDKLLAMMKDKNIYPFKGWWPKTCFIVTQVKEDPNVEVDKDALIITTSKRTKKSRFNDDTSLVDLRPTVPSKWDSDYDGSPVADKVVEVTKVPQNIEININDNVSMVVKEEDNFPVVIHQEEAMDTKSDIGEDEPKIDVNVNQVIPILSHQSQDVSKLNNEYVEFLKIVSAEKIDENIKNDMSNTNTSTVVEMENENNLSIKSNLLQDESVHDESVQGDSVQEESVQDESEEDTSNKTSDESVSLHNVSQRPIDIPFAEHLSSDKKLKKKKKSVHKKSKKMKKKGNKKKRRSKSSSSESSQDSESESDSSSENSMSDTSNSSSTVEKKKKKKKSKDKKKRKDKTNYKKKHKSDKNKIKKFENEKDSSNIINLLEKAFNVEIKKRPLSDSEGSRQKKKKRKHNKKDDKSNENNEDKLEKVKECLKETFTKLVKNDNDQSCDKNTVHEVLKYFNMDKEKEKKNKKSKKSSKRKYDSDISENSKITKKSKLDNSLKFENVEKKKKSSKKKKIPEKKSVSNNSESKRKTKKKSKLTTDTSETEDGEESKQKKPQSEEIENFFGQRPNEWNVNNSSMRGVVHHSDTKQNDKPSKKSQLHENSCSSKGNKDENSIESKNILLLDKCEMGNKRENDMGKALETPDSNFVDSISKNIIGKIEKNNLENTDFEDNENNVSYTISDQCGKYVLKHKDVHQPTMLSTNNDYNEQKDQNKNPNNVKKPTISKSLDQNGKTELDDEEDKISYTISDQCDTNMLKHRDRFPRNSLDQNDKTELDDEEVEISNTISDQCDTNMLNHKDDLPKTMLLSTNNDYNKQEDPNKDSNNVTRPTVSKPLDLNHTPPLTTIVKPLISSGESMSYREKVKMNLKKLSTYQHNIPFVFGFPSPLNLIKSKQLEFDEINKSPKAFEEEDGDSKSLNLVDSQKILSEQTQSKKPNEAQIVTPKIDMEANNELVGQNFGLVYSDAYNKQSSTTSTNIENVTDAQENEQSESSLLEHDSLDSDNDYEALSNDCELKELEHTPDTTESSSSSDEENNREFCPGFENNLTTSADLSDSNKPEQNFDESLNSVQCHNKFNEVSNINNELVMTTASLEIDSSDCLHNSSIDQENPQIDNELITQWMSDWSKVVNMPVETNNSNNFRFDYPNIQLQQRRKKSRWDEPPNYEQENYNEPISSSFTTKDFNNENLSSNVDNFDEEYFKTQSPLMNESPNYEQEKYNDTISSNYTTKNFNNEHFSSNVDTFEVEQNCTSQSPLINEPPNYEQDKYNDSISSSYTTKVYNNENLSSNVDTFEVEQHFTIPSPLINESPNYEQEKYNDTLSSSYTTKVYNNENLSSNVDNFDEEYFTSQKPSNYEQEKYNDTISSSYTTKIYNNENLSSNVDNLEEQHFISQSPLINCVTDNTEYNYSANWGSEYVDHTQPYHEYSCPPQYSEIQTIDHNLVDYNMYENIDPSYDYYNENDKMWESIDTIDQPTITETSIQLVGDVLEMSSNDIYTKTEFSKDEAEFNGNITTIMPTEDESFDEENPESPCSESPNDQFLKLFHQHFEHYNQNPIKYSLSEPILDHVAEINTSVPEKSPIQENSDSNNIDDIPIPLRERAYSSLIQDDNTTIYMTSDSYIAYVAINDKCMVHVAVNTSNINGIDDEVRHCFNIYQNGKTVEYWLHADLIPFVVPSDGEVGVFTNAEEVTAGSDSCQEDNNDDVNDDIIEGEWNLVEAKNDYWQNIQEMYEHARVFKKYGYGNRVNQTVIPEENFSNSSEEDSYESESSDSVVETCSIESKNIAASTILESLIAKGNQSVSNIATDTNTAGYEQTENVAPCAVVSMKTEHDENVTPTDQLMLNVKSENNNTNEIPMEEDLNLNIKTEYNENILNKSKNNKDDNRQELDVPSIKEIPVEELMRMNTIVKQQTLVQRLKMYSKENIQKKLPDTELVQYSDNMEVVKHPFLGLFQPPTFSILSKVRNDDKKDVSKLSKRVTFADGIHPGNIQAASPTHDKASRSISPPPLKKLMRETLKLKHNMYPLNRSKIRVKLNMIKKKVAKVFPVVKDPTSSSVIEYYIRRSRLSDLPIPGTVNHTVETDNSRRSHNTYVRTRNRHRSILRQRRITREVTPVPSGYDGWSDNVI